MRLDVFSGRDVSAVCAQARAALGDDALILHARSLGDGTRTWIEVEAAAAADVAKLMNLLKPASPRVAPKSATSVARDAYVVAVVGPTGAGKTTTLAKLAANPGAFGTKQAGFLTLDTHRAGAFEQLAAYADAAGVPCELAYDRAELKSALKKLSSCDVILVDTPGRGPRSSATATVWRSLLRDLRPHETHLVVPATMRADVIMHMRAHYGAQDLTHTLITKLDEVPTDSTLAATISRLGLHAAWITDGQDVPGDLHAAASRVVGSLGGAPSMQRLA